MTRLLFVVVVISALSLALAIKEDSYYEGRFSTFMKKFDRRYESQEEFAKRFKIFRQNLEKIEAHNELAQKGFKTYTMGVNQFTDLTNEEYRERFLGFKPKQIRIYNSEKPKFKGPLPQSVDWRDHNAVTYIKDQGQCGSCWSFSSTGAIEGAWAIAKNKLISLSEQNLLDCTWGHPYNNTGCDGGDMREAMTYVINNKGIDTEDSYPYEDSEGGGEGECQYSKKNFGASISSLVAVIEGNETDLAWATTITPVSVAIDASQDSFQNYESGIYYEPMCGNSMDDLDHGVLVVGYDSYYDYWIVKNSWGPGWGMEGYILMAMNDDNQCGIATYATWAKV